MVFATAALLADGRGAHGLAFYALVAAIPFAAVAGLNAFGDFLEGRGDTLLGAQSALWAVAVTLLVLSCAVRSSAAAPGSLPPLGASTLVLCLAVFALKVVLGVAPFVRRAAYAPAKP
jgi:hypothetical protein